MPIDFRQVVLGVVLFLVYWGFHVGYFDFLGAASLFVGALFISFLPWLTEIGAKMKPAPDAIKKMWLFATAFVVIGTGIAVFAGPALGMAIADVSQAAPLMVGIWLLVFGAGSVAHGVMQKHPIMLTIGIIWVFSAVAVTTVAAVAANAYLHFALIVGLSFALGGVFASKKSG